MFWEAGQAEYCDLLVKNSQIDFAYCISHMTESSVKKTQK